MGVEGGLGEAGDLAAQGEALQPGVCTRVPLIIVKVGPVAFHDSLGKVGEAEVRVMLIQKLGPGFEEVGWQCWALQEMAAIEAPRF